MTARDWAEWVHDVTEAPAETTAQLEDVRLSTAAASAVSERSSGNEIKGEDIWPGRPKFFLVEQRMHVCMYVCRRVLRENTQLKTAAEVAVTAEMRSSFPLFLIRLSWLANDALSGCRCCYALRHNWKGNSFDIGCAERPRSLHTR